MLILHIIIGLILLMFGRKIFWLLVAVSGFMVGVQFSEMIIPYSSQWIQLSVALGVGIAGALLAILLQRVAFVLAGFLSGLYMALLATQYSGFNDVSYVLFIAGGAVGAVTGYVFIDWAIIVLSSLVGAGVIFSAIAGTSLLTPTLNMLLFMTLSIMGSLIQIRLMDAKRDKKNTD